MPASGIRLKSVKIPATAKKLGEDAFAGCDELKTVYVANGKSYDGLPSDVKIIKF